MIETHGGKTEIDVKINELLADYSCITHALFNLMKKEGIDEDLAISKLKVSFDDAFKSEDILIKELIDEAAKYLARKI